MNMKTIKEFIALRQELKASGIIAVSVHEDEVHVRSETLVDMDVTCKTRDCDTYPYEVSVMVDDVKLFAILREEELKNLYPQFAGYLVEDVNLDGMGEEEHAV
jgi:hypothetical protein